MMPTMIDRACQALAKQALEPQWEAQFERNSYGFRPGRSCHDAIEAIFSSIKHKDKYVLDADIAGCFDQLNHSVLLDILAEEIHDNRFLRLIKQLLQAGYLEEWRYHDTYSGSPQGGWSPRQ